MREAVLCDNSDDTASTSAISSASNVPDFSALHIKGIVFKRINKLKKFIILTAVHMHF